MAIRHCNGEAQSRRGSFGVAKRSRAISAKKQVVHAGVTGVIRVGMVGRHAWEIGGDLLLSRDGNPGKTWYNQAVAEGVAGVRGVQ